MAIAIKYMKERGVDHSDILSYLKKVEGQIRGIQRMVEEGRYCIDILTQIHSAVGALSNIEDNILKKHFENCVVNTFRAKSKIEREKKIEELLDIISKFRR